MPKKAGMPAALPPLPIEKPTALSLATEPLGSSTPVDTGRLVSGPATAKQTTTQGIDGGIQWSQSTRAGSLQPQNNILAAGPDNLAVQPSVADSPTTGLHDKDTPTRSVPGDSTTSKLDNLSHQSAAGSQQPLMIGPGNAISPAHSDPRGSTAPVQYDSPTTQLTIATQLPAEAMLSDGVTSTRALKAPPPARPDDRFVPSTLATQPAITTAFDMTPVDVAPHSPWRSLIPSRWGV
ncbi:hypothetical protein ACHAPT_013046 [Fusarium lateritium]